MIGRLAIGYAILCEYAGAAVFLLYAAMCVLLAIKGHNSFRSLIGALICLGIAIALFFTARAAVNFRRWAYWTSLAYGLSIGLFGAAAIRDAYLGVTMPNARGEEGFGFLIGVVLAFGSLIGLVGLALPPTRREVFGKTDSNSAV